MVARRKWPVGRDAGRRAARIRRCFTQQEGEWLETRALPAVIPGDYLVLHDTGAYGVYVIELPNTPAPAGSAV